MIALVLANESITEDSNERTRALESQIQRLKQEFRQYCEIVKRNEEKNQQKIKTDIVKKLLPVADTLDRAKKRNDYHFLSIGGKKIDNIKKNIETTYGQLLSSLDIEEINPKIGEKLICEKHIAIQKRDSLYPDNVIIECVRKGYILDGCVIRPAEVVVSKYRPRFNNKDDKRTGSSGVIRYHPC